MDPFKAGKRRFSLTDYLSGKRNLLWHRDRHGVTNDLNQLAIRVGLTNKDSGIATPTQSEPRSIMKNCVRIPRALDMEVDITLERRPDPPVQDKPQLGPNISKLLTFPE